MIDFLNNCGISKHTVEKLYDIYDDSILYNLSCNEDECIKIVEVFKHIKIDIDIVERLLIERIDLFLMPVTRLISRIEKVGVSKFIEMINQDLSNIDIIYED